MRFENAKCAGGGVPTFSDVTDGLAWKYAEHWQMLVAQVYNLKWCGDAIDEYTKATGVRFDQVIKSRPDVAFANAIDPYCKVRRTARAIPLAFTARTFPRNSMICRKHVKAGTGFSCCRA